MTTNLQNVYLCFITLSISHYITHDGNITMIIAIYKSIKLVRKTIKLIYITNTRSNCINLSINTLLVFYYILP